MDAKGNWSQAPSGRAPRTVGSALGCFSGQRVPRTRCKFTAGAEGEEGWRWDVV